MQQALANLTLYLEDNAQPYYQQLIEQITLAIQQQRLKAGDKLVSSRALAQALGISRSTVVQAYDQLVAEGFLVSAAKRGVFVAEQAYWLSTDSSPTKIIATESTTVPPHFSLGSGVDVTLFAHKEWAASLRRCGLLKDPVLLQGGYESGYPELKQAIVAYLYRLRGLQTTPEQIFLTAGNRDALILLRHTLMSLLSPVEWCLENPTYPPIRALFAQSDQAIRDLNVDADGTVPPIQTAHAQVAILTPSRQYPLGMSFSPLRRQAWQQRLQQQPSLWLIEDDYDSEFCYQGRSSVPLMQHDTSERICYVGSFSKVMFRGLRMGFVVVPTPAIAVFAKAQQQLGSASAQMLQPAVADFMLRGQFERHLNRMRRHYRLKRDALLAWLDQYVAAYFDWQKPNGGMHILIYFKATWLAQRPQQYWDQIIQSQLKQQRIHLVSLSEHYHTQPRQGFVLGFTEADRQTMEYVIQQLAQCLRER